MDTAPSIFDQEGGTVFFAGVVAEDAVGCVVVLGVVCWMTHTWMTHMDSEAERREGKKARIGVYGVYMGSYYKYHERLYWSYERPQDNMGCIWGVTIRGCIGHTRGHKTTTQHNTQHTTP